MQQRCISKNEIHVIQEVNFGRLSENNEGCI